MKTTRMKAPDKGNIITTDDGQVFKVRPSGSKKFVVDGFEDIIFPTLRSVKAAITAGTLGEPLADAGAVDQQRAEATTDAKGDAEQWIDPVAILIGLWAKGVITEKTAGPLKDEALATIEAWGRMIHVESDPDNKGDIPDVAWARREFARAKAARVEPVDVTNLFCPDCRKADLIEEIAEWSAFCPNCCKSIAFTDCGEGG